MILNMSLNIINLSMMACNRMTQIILTCTRMRLSIFIFSRMTEQNGIRITLGRMTLNRMPLIASGYGRVLMSVTFCFLLNVILRIVVILNVVASNWRINFNCGRGWLCANHLLRLVTKRPSLELKKIIRHQRIRYFYFALESAFMHIF